MNHRNSFKTRWDDRQELTRRYKENQKNNDVHKFKSFGFYDFLFFFIIMIISLLCKILDLSFQ